MPMTRETLHRTLPIFRRTRTPASPPTLPPLRRSWTGPITAITSWSHSTDHLHTLYQPAKPHSRPWGDQRTGERPGSSFRDREDPEKTGRSLSMNRISQHFVGILYKANIAASTGISYAKIVKHKAIQQLPLLHVSGSFTKSFWLAKLQLVAIIK